ncbi:Copper sensory histidine kinase CpxA [Klebsiella pneumoniae]|uniref:histidine kinase n=1 Tax=Klebsiella pneumoniae TaxID=573 RepID=A0A4P0XPP1_KLEPN|nr:Copper sensory histidine kinase CpxA [Klebsiella pneumoniae]
MPPMKSPRATLRQHPELEAGPQEFLAAGASFNQMVTALERMMTSQQRLLSDISHELRTPLTRLQLGTALLRRRSGESKELERIETEAHRLDSMINDLLVMSRNQAKNAPGQRDGESQSAMERSVGQCGV